MTRRATLTTLLSLILGALFAAPGFIAAQEQPSDPVATVPDSGGAKVMILGSSHFSQQPELVTGAERERELEAVLDALQTYRPTKKLVEEEPRDSVRMDSLYQAYREGRWELQPNERYLIGFRLAHRTGLDRVWAIDYQHPWPMDKVTSFAERYDSAYLAYRQQWADRARSGSQQLAVLEAATLDCFGRSQRGETVTRQSVAGGPPGQAHWRGQPPG